MSDRLDAIWLDLAHGTAEKEWDGTCNFAARPTHFGQLGGVLILRRWAASVAHQGLGAGLIHKINGRIVIGIVMVKLGLLALN